MAGRTDRTWAALALAGCALLSLVLGGWVGFRDENTAGGNVPTVFVALALLGAAVLISLGHPRTRLVLGALCVVLVCALIVAGAVDDFRFVWRSDENALFVLEVGLAALGMTLLAPAYLVPGGSATGAQASDDAPMSAQAIAGGELPGAARLGLWVVTAVVAGVVGYNLGSYSYGGADCAGVVSDECSRARVAGLLGLGLALAAVALTCVGVVVIRWRHRRAPRH